MSRMIFIALFGFMLQISPARADDCLNNAASNADFAKCYDAKIKETDLQLNKNWKQVAAYLQNLQKTSGSKAYQTMLNEQRHWIRFKEKACQYYRTKTMDFGREGAVIGYGSCQLSILQDRVKYLENFLIDRNVNP